MSATATQIRRAIASALQTALPDVQALPFALSSPTPPFAQVVRGDVIYDQAMAGGTHTWTMRVQVGVGGMYDQAASERLDEYLSADGARSVKQAIEADTTLGGIVQTLHVTSANGEIAFRREQGADVLGSEWQVQVWL